MQNISKKPYYIFYPSPLQEDPKDPSKILSDLGRATKRGIKKCFKCGTYNGTRGLMCKNKQCDAVFKECGEKQRTSLDAIKLVSGDSRQVFSVRVRDKGPDCRGFVQLPLMQGSDEVNEKSVALSEVALCFVDSCQRLFDDSILKCHETERSKVMSICIHIRSALKSVNVAMPIEIKSSLLSSLQFQDDVKHKLWLLSSETEGALVQRVSKTVMAVKCQVTPKHPLGYLHFMFCVSKGKETYGKFYCSCLNFKAYSYLNGSPAALNQKCVHYYACIWAFASDLKFAEEFIDFLNLELCSSSRIQPMVLSNMFLKGKGENSAEYLYLDSVANILKKTKFCNKKVSKHQSCYSGQRPNFYSCNVQINTVCKSANVATKLPNKFTTEEYCDQNIPVVKRHKTSSYYLPKMQASLSFIDWLGSVTERINQTLYYRQSGCVESLNFYVPVKFFDMLVDKLQSSNKKQNDSFVISGTSGISYFICSIPYLKEIFDTPQVPLQVMEVFGQNEQGGFTKLVCQEQESTCKSLAGCKQIVTFLKVGMGQTEGPSVPFMITWTSNVLPVSNFGKLELVFHVECCDAVQFSKYFT